MQDTVPMVIERLLPFARSEIRLRPSLPFVRHQNGDRFAAQGMGGAA